MHYFAFETEDTKEHIWEFLYNKTLVTPVYMVDDKGNSWEEKNYRGQGDFGGKNYFELVAEMNGRRGKNLKEKGFKLVWNRPVSKSAKPLKFPKVLASKIIADKDFTKAPSYMLNVTTFNFKHLS